ncbi:hypothetical protein OGATHE_002409 [Ogataea polymorpha]|uniref:Uncharacterized protein n=1 Tax=Ogataea polymorpha TaxID=460523 RepID=A0A9P8PE30_9ASCO|nr:hypothetical protein OGATHE_002409 [Ogataea polymorpha]
MLNPVVISIANSKAETHHLNVLGSVGIQSSTIKLNHSIANCNSFKMSTDFRALSKVLKKSRPESRIRHGIDNKARHSEKLLGDELEFSLHFWQGASLANSGAYSVSHTFFEPIGTVINFGRRATFRNQQNFSFVEIANR